MELLKSRIKGVSLVETLISFLLILIFLGLFYTTLGNLKKNDSSYILSKANMRCESIFNDFENKAFEGDHEYHYEGYTIQQNMKSVKILGVRSDMVSLTIIDRNNRKLFTFHKIIKNAR